MIMINRMICYTFGYSIRVWLTSVVMAPMLFMILTFCNEGVYHQSFKQVLHNSLFGYLAFVFLEVCFSFIPWMAFLVAVQYTVSVVAKPAVRIWLVFTEGILLTAATCIIYLSPNNVFNVTDKVTCVMICNCICMGWGIWYYRLEPAED
jgi:hypothetical protein